MSMVYEIMKYEYDGCGSSTDEHTYDPLQKTLEGAQKLIKAMEGWGFEVGEEKFYGLVAVQRSGQYAYTRYYIEERELED